MSRLTLICDMDEVIFDLSDTVRERVNKDFNKNYPKGFNKNYWWSDYEGIPQKYFEDLLNEKGLFLNLKPYEGAIEVLTKLNNEGYDIHILTFPQYNATCFIEKVESIRNYLPFINIETNFHTSGDKGLFARENRVIIDDNIKYLQSFKDNGGIAIAFNQPWNSEFKGHRAFDWNEVYRIIKNIEITGTNVDIKKFREYMIGGYYE